MEAQLAKVMNQRFTRKGLLLAAVGGGLGLTACSEDKGYVVEPETMPDPTATLQPESDVQELTFERQARQGHLTAYVLPTGEIEKRYGHPNFDAQTPLPTDLVLVHEGDEYFQTTVRSGGAYTYTEYDVYSRDREYVFLFDGYEREPVDKVYLANSRGDTDIGGYSVTDTQWRSAGEVFNPDHLLPEDADNPVFSFRVRTTTKTGRSEFEPSEEGANVRRVMNHDHFVIFEKEGELSGQIREIYAVKAPV